MDETTKKKVLSLIAKAENKENGARNDFERGKAIGEFRGILKTLQAIGFDVVYDDDCNAVDIEII